MSEGLIKLQLALSQGPQFSVTGADREDEKDQKGILGTEDYNNNEQLNKFNDLPRLSEKNKGEILTLGEHTNHLAQEKGKHQRQAGINQQVKSGKIKEEGSRVYELQSQVETGHFELAATRESTLNEAEQEEQPQQNQHEMAEEREVQLQVTEPHYQFELNQQEQAARMCEQINEFYEQDKYLREQQQLDIQLQSQLETKQQEFVRRMKEQLNSFLGQKELLREEHQEQPQLTAELHNHLEIYQQDWIKEAGQVNGIQGKEKQRTKEKQPVFELQNQPETNQQELTRMREQLNKLLHGKGRTFKGRTTTSC